MALEFTALRLLSANQKSRVPAVEASMLKVRGTELRQAIYELLVDIAGPNAVPFSAEAQFLGERRRAGRARRAGHRWRRTTSTRASCRSTAVPTKCSAI